MSLLVKFDGVDAAIRDDRTVARNALTGPQVGDYLRLHNGDLRRVAHVWDWGEKDDGVQPDAPGYGGSWYLEESGRGSYSGGLDPMIPFTRIGEPERLMRDAGFWFFHHDWPTAHNGVNFPIRCRVYPVTKEPTMSTPA